MNEGDVQEVCVTVDNHEQSRERSIPLKVVSDGLISGMKQTSYMYTHVRNIICFYLQIKVI